MCSSPIPLNSTSFAVGKTRNVVEEALQICQWAITNCEFQRFALLKQRRIISISAATAAATSPWQPIGPNSQASSDKFPYTFITSVILKRGQREPLERGPNGLLMGCHSIVSKREGEKGASCRLSFLFRGSDCACKVFVWQLRHIFSGHSSSAFATANLARHHRPGNRHNDHHHLGKQSSSCLSSSAMCYKSTKMALVIVPAGEGGREGHEKTSKTFNSSSLFAFSLYSIFSFLFFFFWYFTEFFFSHSPLGSLLCAGLLKSQRGFWNVAKMCHRPHLPSCLPEAAPPLSFADRKVGGSLFYQRA